MGLLTELSVTEASANQLVLGTSKRKTIFATAFLVSGTILGLMWFAAADFFNLMLQTGGVVDHIIVGCFYVSMLCYPLLALGFLGYHRKIVVERGKGWLELSHCLFGIPIWRRRLKLNQFKSFQLQLIQKGRNIAHEHEHLADFRNSGYWQIVAVETHGQREIRIDRNTSEKDMENLGKVLQTYTNLPFVSRRLQL